MNTLVDGILSASRALVAVAARSLAAVADDVTLAQYRVLVELAARGPLRGADLAAALHVDRSTATRMCDRLLRKRLVARRRTTEDRREVRISLTSPGRALVDEVSRRRRDEIGQILERLPAAHREWVTDALRAFADAAGEVPEQDWSLGWRLEG
jgi:DNA-binding MarR family transcriptional regulator